MRDKRLDLGCVAVDLEEEPYDQVYFCPDELYGYYSLKEFKAIIESLNIMLKRVEDFYESRGIKL